MNTVGDDLGAVVEEEFKAALDRGIAENDLPAAVADRVRQRMAGHIGYVRKRKLSPAERQRRIVQEFTGNNAAELAKKYELTVRRIGQIISSK